MDMLHPGMFQSITLITPGIFPRVNANGDLALDVVNASPEDTETLLSQLSGNSEDVILRMPKPDSDQQYLN